MFALKRLRVTHTDSLHSRVLRAVCVPPSGQPKEKEASEARRNKKEEVSGRMHPARVTLHATTRLFPDSRSTRTRIHGQTFFDNLRERKGVSIGIPFLIYSERTGFVKSSLPLHVAPLAWGLRY